MRRRAGQSDSVGLHRAATAQWLGWSGFGLQPYLGRFFGSEGLDMVEEKARSELGMVKPNEIFVQYLP